MLNKPKYVECTKLYESTQNLVSAFIYDGHTFKIVFLILRRLTILSCVPQWHTSRTLEATFRTLIGDVYLPVRRATIELANLKTMVSYYF